MRTVILFREQAVCGPLVLVNAAHPLSDVPAPELAAPSGRHPGGLMERRAERWLDACARGSGYNNGFIVIVWEAVS